MGHPGHGGLNLTVPFPVDIDLTAIHPRRPGPGRAADGTA